MASYNSKNDKSTGKKHAKGMEIVSVCPECSGKGKIPKEPPLFSNPKAPITNPKRSGMRDCPRCGGTGMLGLR